ncbi:hypothetical protein BC567DRAFT_66158 [Phyllosticta citribraziliensis]
MWSEPSRVGPLGSSEYGRYDARMDHHNDMTIPNNCDDARKKWDSSLSDYQPVLPAAQICRWPRQKSPAGHHAHLFGCRQSRVALTPSPIMISIYTPSLPSYLPSHTPNSQVNAAEAQATPHFRTISAAPQHQRPSPSLFSCLYVQLSQRPWEPRDSSSSLRP